MNAPRSPAIPSGAPREGIYESSLFERFTKSVERRGAGSAVLDLGPSISENLMFWIRRGHGVSAIDCATHIAAGENIEISGGPFAGVLGWNVLSGLPPAEAASLMQRLQDALIPGGVLLAMFDGDGRTAPPALRYRIVDGVRLRIETASLSFAPRAVPTKEIERLFAGLQPMRVTVMRHGSREALGQRARPVADPFPGARAFGDLAQ